MEWIPYPVVCKFLVKTISVIFIHFILTQCTVLNGVKNWCVFGKEAYKKLSYFASFGKQNYVKNFLATLPFLLVIFKLAILYCVNMYLYIFFFQKVLSKATIIIAGDNALSKRTLSKVLVNISIHFFYKYLFHKFFSKSGLI